MEEIKMIILMVSRLNTSKTCWSFCIFAVKINLRQPGFVEGTLRFVPSHTFP